MVNHGADRRGRDIHREDPGFYCDALRSGTNGQLKVDFKSILDVKDYLGLDQFFEAGLFDFESIAAGT